MNKLITGGAHGSDCVFATCALNIGICVDIHSFDGHTITEPKSSNQANIITHTEEELKFALPYIKEANSVLKRKVPPPGYIRNLLCRNYYQIENTDCIIAIGNYDRRDSTVEGGTGWAIQMALNKNLTIYFFDQRTNIWLYSSNGRRLESKWNKPKLNLSDYDLVTGIGSRDLTYRGSREIISLFEG